MGHSETHTSVHLIRTNLSRALRQRREYPATLQPIFRQLHLFGIWHLSSGLVKAVAETTFGHVLRRVFVLEALQDQAV